MKEITKKLVYPKVKKIKTEKEKQINFLREIIDK